MPGIVRTQFEVLNAGAVGNLNGVIDVARQGASEKFICDHWTSQRLCQMAANTWLQAVQPQAAAVSVISQWFVLPCSAPLCEAVTVFCPQVPHQAGED